MPFDVSRIRHSPHSRHLQSERTIWIEMVKYWPICVVPPSPLPLLRTLAAGRKRAHCGIKPEYRREHVLCIPDDVHGRDLLPALLVKQPACAIGRPLEPHVRW